ncbi:uncharacterized protein K02A2.6-like, partial [Teleopsis dalmanni]|uniref:uncharacterized protein K02A2.6-like n=1 Tax=Teleopsis dalmanni TaxID=139649 RepID=UPI0018CEE485
MNAEQFNLLLQAVQKSNDALLEELRLSRTQQQIDAPSSTTEAVSSTFRNLSDSMLEFCYDPENNVTFESWYKRYKSVFAIEAAHLTELLLWFDCSLEPHELTLMQTVAKLSSIFGYRQSKFSQRQKCLTISKQDYEDFALYAARVNKHCEKFDIVNCTPDEFKAQIFVNGLKSSHDSLILEKLLARLDNESTQFGALQTQAQKDAFMHLTLQDLTNEAERIICLKQDKYTVVQPSSSSEVFTIHHRYQRKNESLLSNSSTKDESSKPPTPSNQVAEKKSQPDTSCVKKIDETNRTQQHRRYVRPNLNGSTIKLQLDTGSDITIISKSNWTKLGQPILQTTNKKAGDVSGNVIPLLGSFACVVNLNGREEYDVCYVTPLKLNVFGIDWITTFDLWSVPISSFCKAIQLTSCDKLNDEIKARFPSLFSNDLGCCTKTQATLRLKEGARPVYRNARPVPYAAAPIVSAELERLQHLGVISPIEYSQSAAPIVVVRKKNGKIRICADYSTGLNDGLEPNKYPLPTLDQIFSKLANKKVFSTIDLSDAFFQIPVDQESQKLMAINTHLGLFKVLRLQQGVKTAPGIFQQIVDTMLSGTNTIGFIDDMICSGINEEDHKIQLFKTLERIQDYGFKLRFEKCKFGETSVEFCGHTVDQYGIRPHPGKLRSIQDLPPPTNLQQTRAFLGAVNYYGKFIKSMKSLRGALDELLKKDKKFEWKQHHNEAFNKIKNVLASDLCLTHFDPAKKIILATDASEYGMGAVLMHQFNDGTLHPIMHYSATFNAAERKYPQMHKEARALVFGLKKCHYYISGRRFTIHIDHKPLLAIFNPKNGIPLFTAAHLQRYATTILSYDFSIEYINTDSFGYADIISRLIANHVKPDEDTVIASIQLEEDEDLKINCFAVETATKLPITFTNIQTATKACHTLNKVTFYIQNDCWPQKRKQITDNEVAAFFQHRHHLTIQQQSIFFGERIVIPKIYHQQVLEDLHNGHP